MGELGSFSEPAHSTCAVSAPLSRLLPLLLALSAHICTYCAQVLDCAPVRPGLHKMRFLAGRSTPSMLPPPGPLHVVPPPPSLPLSLSASLHATCMCLPAPLHILVQSSLWRAIGGDLYACCLSQPSPSIVSTVSASSRVLCLHLSALSCLSVHASAPVFTCECLTATVNVQVLFSVCVRFAAPLRVLVLFWV